MRHLLITITFCLFSVLTVAQQRPHYTQYILNQYILNPAITGIENYTDLKVSARDQWVGLNGAPRTAYLTVHAPLGKKDYRTSTTSFEIPGQNPRGKYYWENYTAAEAHHGVGFSVINDKTGSFNRYSAGISYAYHLGLSATTNLSAGFSAGITQIGMDKDKHDFDGQGDTYDPITGPYIAGELRKARPDLSVGLYLYSRDYFIGISAQQVIPQTLTFVDNAPVLGVGKLVPHLFFNAGYRFLLNEDINAIPSLMVKYIKGSSSIDIQPELNLKLQYRDLLWVGGSVRVQDGYAAMLGLHVNNKFNIGYAHDFSATPLNTVSKGTHELMLGFIIGNKYSQACPRCW